MGLLNAGHCPAGWQDEAMTMADRIVVFSLLGMLLGTSWANNGMKSAVWSVYSKLGFVERNIVAACEKKP